MLKFQELVNIKGGGIPHHISSEAAAKAMSAYQCMMIGQRGWRAVKTGAFSG